MENNYDNLEREIYGIHEDKIIKCHVDAYDEVETYSIELNKYISIVLETTCMSIDKINIYMLTT